METVIIVEGLHSDFDHDLVHGARRIGLLLTGLTKLLLQPPLYWLGSLGFIEPQCNVKLNLGGQSMPLVKVEEEAGRRYGSSEWHD